jgi:CheY-like chemotaxis protein
MTRLRPCWQTSSRARYDVQLVQDEACSLASVRHRRPDAVVLDLILPVMNGWDFVERDRAVNESQ